MYSLDVLHMPPGAQYHCRWPKTASWKFEACWFLACDACHKRTTFSTFRSNTESLLLGSKEEPKGTHSMTGNNWIYQSLSPTDAKGLQLSWLQWFGIWIIDLSVRRTSRKGLQCWNRPYTTISHRIPVLQSYFQNAMSKEGMQELPSYRKIGKSEIWIWTSLNPALNTLLKGLQLWPCQEGDVLRSCAILLRLASYLLRDLEIRKVFLHFIVSRQTHDSLWINTVEFRFLIILININHHMIKRCGVTTWCHMS